MKNYRHIRAWGAYMGSLPYYVNDQVELAILDDAPENAIYYGGGKWATADQIETPEVREAVEKLAASFPAKRGEKKLYLDIDNLLEEFSRSHDHMLSCDEEQKQAFLDKFAAEWRKLAEKNLYEAEE